MEFNYINKLKIGDTVRFKQPIELATLVEFDDEYVYFRHDYSPAVFRITKETLEEYIQKNELYALTPDVSIPIFDILSVLDTRQGYIEDSKTCNADKPDVMSELLGAERTVELIRDAILSLIPTAEQGGEDREDT